MTFDPNSNDAMFAQILAKLDEQKSLLDDIKESLEKAEHRITGIPDKVLRPARKEVDVKDIGAQMKYKDKGYAVVEPLMAPNE